MKAKDVFVLKEAVDDLNEGRSFYALQELSSSEKLNGRGFEDGRDREELPQRLPVCFRRSL